MDCVYRNKILKFLQDKIKIHIYFRYLLRGCTEILSASFLFIIFLFKGTQINWKKFKGYHQYPSQKLAHKTMS